MKIRFKRIWLSIVILMAFNTNSKAQWVPADTGLVEWLYGHKGSSYAKITNYTIDTTKAHADTTLQILDYTYFPHPVYIFRTLNGIQYFRNLKQLSFFSYDTSLRTFPVLPNKIWKLEVFGKGLRRYTKFPDALTYFDGNYSHSNNGSPPLTLPSFPNKLTYIYLYSDSLTSLPTLPDSLTDLYCDYNMLTSLPSLPPNLYTLDCRNNQLTSLPTLNSKLVDLYCSNNSISSLPALDNHLGTLWCDNNKLYSLPRIPVSLNTLDCSDNYISYLPRLDSLHYLQDLACVHNKLTYIPYIDTTWNYVNSIWCDSNSITALSNLPYCARISCSYNQLTSPPNLRSTIQYLNCSNNKLTSLPYLPGYSFTELHCDHNNLSTLPNIPATLTKLDCSYNKNLGCLPPFTNPNLVLKLDSTAVQCVPSYMCYIGTPGITKYPLCTPGNLKGCNYAYNISGYCYEDSITNCVKDIAEPYRPGVKVLFYHADTLTGIAYTFGKGTYTFKTAFKDTIVCSIDTTHVPYKPRCPASDTLQCILSAADSVRAGYNFGLECKHGYDGGVWNIYTRLIRPGYPSAFQVNAGDVSTRYNMHCLSGIGGTVKAYFKGKVKYDGVVTGALTPDTAHADTVIWKITDFGSINPAKAFNFIIKADTAARSGDTVQIKVVVSLNTTDIDTSNNTLIYYIRVRNSCDPNEKEVSPFYSSFASPTQWLTYTIHFQNTGSAPAINIHINDTLDPNLDISTFDWLASSYPASVSFIGKNVVQFQLNGINLPDSSSNATGSIGYVKYRIKPKAKLATGSAINNKAYIYFDFNNPIITNTVSDTFGILPKANFVLKDTLLCYSDTVKFVNLSYKGTNYTWYFGDGTSSNLKKPVHFYKKCGNYTVKLIINDGKGHIDSLEKTNCVKIYCYGGGIANAGGKFYTCPGVKVQIGKSAYCYNCVYKWWPQTGLTSLNTDVTKATVTKPTTYYQTGFYLPTKQCSVDSAIITTTRLPLKHSDTMCLNSYVKLACPNTYWCTYKWTPHTGLKYDSLDTVTARPTVSMMYYLTTHNYGAGGCVQHDSIYVQVNNNPIRYSTIDTSSCPATGIKIGWPAHAHYAYSWAPGTALSSTAAVNPIANPTVNTQYRLTIKDSLTGCTSNDTLNITVDSIYVPGAIAGSKLPLPVNTLYTLKNTKGKKMYWKALGGSIIYGQGTDSVTVKWSRIGVDTLKVFSAPCSDTTYLIARVSTGIGIPYSSYVPISIYPNPAHDILNIYYGNASADAELLVYDMTGRVLQRLHVIKNQDHYELDTHALSSGCYIIKTDSANQSAALLFEVVH